MVAGVLLAMFWWLWELFKNARARRLLPSLVSLFFEDTDQFRRTQSPDVNGKKLVRTVYLIGVINNSPKTLHGVRCFVLSVEGYQGEQRRRPLQPLGVPRYAESIDIPRSTNGQPSAYFEFVADHTARDKPAEGTFGWLCVPYGDAMLPPIAHVEVALEGDGFTKPATFSVAKRKRGAETLSGEYIDVRLTPLTVKRIR